jgi:short-subunit dehydrogenase
MSDFATTYGPWAVIAGASEGVGSEFAAEVARRGVNVVLLSRRQSVLDEVAASIADETGVGARTLAVDLAVPGASAQIIGATADLEVGLLLYNAGANIEHLHFLDASLEVAVAMVQRNCVAPTELCHHYAPGMVARGRGGIVIVTSGAAIAGAPNMVTYGASKAYDTVFAEALWAELHDTGVDVLSLWLGETDTPALRRLRAERGIVDDPDTPLPGANTVEQVVAEAIEHLADGPTWMADETLRSAAPMLAGMGRAKLVDLMIQMSTATMGE